MKRSTSCRISMCFAFLVMGLPFLGCGGGSPASKQPPAVSVSISPATATVQVNESVSFTVSVSGTTNKSVTFQVNAISGGNLTVGTISSGGVYTAPAIVPNPASVTITVISLADPTKTASATVTITGPPVTVSVSGPSGLLNTGDARIFAATVLNASNTAVMWSVVEPGGGSITQDGVYTAPATPGTYTVKATSQADPSAWGAASVPVVIPVGHIPGYDVGVDYHAYGADFQHTAFITIYHQAEVRDVVRAQLQGMADRGATVISTRIWFVTEPGTDSFGETWRTTFPMSDQEQANLRAYAQDVAAVQGSGGNRLRLDICLLWLGAADYLQGSPSTGLGSTPISAAEFTSRVESTTDKVLAAVGGVTRPDDVPVVDTIYLDGEIMVGAKANQEWFLTAHYPRFVSHVSQAGFQPAVYFIAVTDQAQVLDDGYVDQLYPILNSHLSMYWIYRSLRFIADQGLYIPPRIDFTCSFQSGAPYAQLLARILGDADATLPSLGAPEAYGAAETFYYLDDNQRKQLGQAFAGEAAANPRMKRVCFWTTPDGGGLGVNVAYPFAIEDFFPPPAD